MVAKPTEDEFIADYEDGIAKRVAREAYRAIYPGGMHTNGPTMVRVEVSQLLRILTKWKQPRMETRLEPPCFAEKNDGVFYQCACSKCLAATNQGVTHD